MDSPVASPVSAPAFTAALPDWTLPRGREPDALAAAFAAGIALKSLDDLVRAAPAWAGCWRSRQALKCAAVAVRLMGRNEDEAALRDAVLLTAAGDDPGPAGRMFFAYNKLATRKPAFSSKAVAELADLLGLAWDDRLTAAVDYADDALQSGRPAPFGAADLVTAIHAVRPDAEPLAWMLADRMIAALLKWDFAVPLLMAERYGPAFKTVGGSRAGPIRCLPPRRRCARRAPARSSKGCSRRTPWPPRHPAPLSRAGRRPGCSTGWRDLAQCANCPAGPRSGSMDYDNG